MHSFKRNALWLGIAATSACLTAGPVWADTLIASTSDVTWTTSSGASVISNTAGTLTIQTSKNSQVTAALPSAVTLGSTGDTLTVAFDVQFDNVPVNTTSYFDLAFADSTTLTSGGQPYFYMMHNNPLAGSGQIIGAEGDDTNLGKAVAAGAGTITHAVAFTLTRIDTDTGLNLTETSDLIGGSGALNVNADVGPPPATTTFDTFYFNFKGDAWNEKFGTSQQTIVATITNFSVTTNVSVPEPATLGLVGLGSLCVMARRRSSAER